MAAVRELIKVVVVAGGCVISWLWGDCDPIDCDVTCYAVDPPKDIVSECDVNEKCKVICQRNPGVAGHSCVPNNDCRRRRLQELVIENHVVYDFNRTDIPWTDICIDDLICGDLIIGYSLQTQQSAQDRCDELNLGCDADDIVLFENTLSELYSKIECPQCEDQNKYIVVDDGSERDWIEARQFCLDEFGTDLASVTDVNEFEFQCAVNDILCSEDLSYWTGIYSPNRDTHIRPYCYEFAAGDCPQPHTCACVDQGSWTNRKPLPCTQGAQCVRYSPCDGKVKNDIFCDEKLKGVICNANPTGNGASIPSVCMVPCEHGFGFETCASGTAACTCNHAGHPVTSCNVE